MEYKRMFGDIITFDTTTCELKKEAVNRNCFWSPFNRSANVCENTKIAIVYKDSSYHVLKYTKGDTSGTILGKVCDS